jgi:AraC family transcriptional regulator of adaptative response / DNA-3-methyladenine glycosylase II
LLCRPETAIDLGSWRGTSNTVTRALALIAEGHDGTIEALAERLGVGDRHLRRLFDQHLGVSPIQVAQSRRVLFAKQLIHETNLPMTEVALAAGFKSVRRFNEVFHALYKRPPSQLRRKKTTDTDDAVTVRIRYRPPYDWPAMLAHLKGRAIDGVERIDDDSYTRSIAYEGKRGLVEVRHLPSAGSLTATIRFPDVRALRPIVDRLRHLFDVAADVGAIGAHLARDPMLAPLVRARPGLRTPGAIDGFELAMRAVLGQQITVERARQLLGKLVHICGSKMRSGWMAFPTASQVAAANLDALGMPRARKEALRAVAEAAVENPRLFEALDDVEQTVARLREIRGVGEWTAHYIALRAAREPDAFPHTDAGLLRGADLDARALVIRAERWRPWRAYAAQHLWTKAAS